MFDDFTPIERLPIIDEGLLVDFDDERVIVKLVHDDSVSNPRDGYVFGTRFSYESDSRRIYGGENDESYEENGTEWDVWVDDGIVGDGSYARPWSMAGRMVTLTPFEWLRRLRDAFAIIETCDGYMYMTRAEYEHEKFDSWKRAIDYLHAMEKEWRDWCEGECYGYVIEKTNGEELDSCWGFIGLEWAQSSAIETAEYYCEEMDKKAEANFVRSEN